MKSQFKFSEGDDVRVTDGLEEGNDGVVVEVAGPYVRVDVDEAYHHRPDVIWFKHSHLETLH